MCLIFCIIRMVAVVTTYLYYTDAVGFCQDILENSMKYGTLLM